MLTWRGQRRVYVVLTLLVSLMGTVVFFFNHDRWTPNLLMRSRHPSKDQWHPNISSTPFTPVLGSKTLLLNAFYEHRLASASIRLMGIVWREEEKSQNHCVLCCHDDGRLLTVTAEAEVITHPSHYEFPYCTGDFLCQIPYDFQPRYAGLVTGDAQYAQSASPNVMFLPILNWVERQSHFPLEFTVCVTTMFNRYNNVLQFIQAMELYRLLGAERVVVYKTSCSRSMEDALRYYSNKVGLVVVLPWPIDAHINVSSGQSPSESPGDLHYNGQIPAINDCVYRHMYQSKYLLMHDVDEVILPTGSNSWAKLLSILEKKHENTNFYFNNNVFPLDEKAEHSRYNLAEWEGLDGENFLVHVLREPAESEESTGKMIVNPRSVLQMDVHAIPQHSLGGSTVKIGPELARLYHIRQRKNTTLQNSELIRDEGLLRLAPRLVEQVNIALNNLPNQGRAFDW